MAASEAVWHSIRPWLPPLSLSVREITSVSVTFILSSTHSHLPDDPSLTSLGLDDDPALSDEDDEEDRKVKPFVVASALTKGLSVEIDNASWRRVIIKIDDKVDEAVIIIYGLMPGRQYDIDMALVQDGRKNSIRKQVVTEGQSVPFEANS